MNNHISHAAVAAAALALAGPGQATPTIRHITYHGWANSLQISNRSVDLVYVPELGRIMRYGLVGGRNMLWVNPEMSGKHPDPKVKDWQNFGGDKLWPAPQSVWKWPPDPVLDIGGVVATAEPTGHLLIRGKESGTSGIRFDRDISLDTVGTGVTIINTMVNTSALPVKWSVWEITQINDPDEMKLPLNPGGLFPTGYYSFPGATAEPSAVSVGADAVTLKRNPKAWYKVGSDSAAGSLTADKAGLRISLSAGREPGDYPDEGCSLEIYTSPDPLKYVELEMLGPVRTIPAGQSITLTTHWKLGHI